MNGSSNLPGGTGVRDNNDDFKEGRDHGCIPEDSPYDRLAYRRYHYYHQHFHNSFLGEVMPTKVVAILDCGHGKIVVLQRVGDVICVGLKMYCMDCDKVNLVIEVR